MANVARPKKAKHRFMSLLIGAAVILFLCYAIGTIIASQIEIAQKRDQLAELERQTQLAQEQNEELQRLSSAEDDSEYIERIAREKLGYAYYDERVYYVIPAN